jgi:shikimate dehydrogenase
MITGQTRVAGVVGWPVRHSMSPLIHNYWLQASGMDGVYVAFSPPQDGFSAFANGMRGGAISGLNVTLPFKQHALALAATPGDQVSDPARLSGAANLVLFDADGTVRVDNTDGEGLLYAFARQAPSLNLTSAPVVILGAGGAARGAAAALILAGVPRVHMVNRTLDKAQSIASVLGPKVQVYDSVSAEAAFDGTGAVINATSLGLGGGEGPAVPWQSISQGAVFMDMVYKPLETEFLAKARARGHQTVDGLDMLIGQARPSFEALFGVPPPLSVDVRALALAQPTAA